jgi:hypothetical protein
MVAGQHGAVCVDDEAGADHIVACKHGYQSRVD